MTTVTTISRDWRSALADLIASARTSLTMASPFITAEGSNVLTSNISKEVLERGLINLLTDLSPAHVCDGSLDAKAVERIIDAGPSSQLWHVPRLHAKVYVADDHRAIVTSGNL